MAFLDIVGDDCCALGACRLHHRPQPRMAGYELPHE
jgi:hypothetical protein